MAYAAVISLKHTIEGLLHSSDVWVVPPSQKIIEFAYKEVKSLQEFLKGLDSSSSSERFNSLDGKIREAIYKLEDAIESHVSNQIASQSESLGSHPLLFSVDLRDLEKDICSFSETMKEYIDELRDTLPEEDDVFPSTIDFGGKESKFVGLSDLYNKLKDGLRPSWRVDLQVASVVGMAGIGKTALANEIVKDPYFMEYFDFRAWVTVGRKCRLEEIPRVILTQANPNHTNEMLTEGDQEIAQYLKESLNGKRCLIVLDDVWDKKVWSYLESLFPDNNNGSRVLLTTRLQEVAGHTKGSISGMFHIRLLNEKESWDLLRAKVFGEESCPAQLEKAGKKIAENCDGLPLMIVTVANLLSEAEKTAEYWNIVAEKRTSVFMDAYDEISKVLLPSYECLPQYLKVCFLYMGVFPRNYVIPTSKLIKMWIAEGFLEPNIFQTSEVCAMKCLEELSFNSVVMPHRDSTLRSPMSTYLIKTCSIHSSFRHLCIIEAGKKSFFHVLNNRVDSLADRIKSQRRLCVYNNILFGIKDVYKSIENNNASSTRSVLCLGPYHQYPVPICHGLSKLRLLDALTVRFYEFPEEVLKLVQLKYLALTCNGDLPTSIAKLWKLQFLIVHRHLSIKPSEAPSYLSMGVWHMKELKHLQIMGSDLPDPCGALLPNLLTLSGVSARSCTKGILEGMPKLEKLGITIELAVDAAEPLCYFDNISHLIGIDSLKCVIVNPELKSEVVTPLTPLSALPSGLLKLTLSGLGYPWEEIRKIATLPYLQVLKLRCYAFRGPKWEVEENGFQDLRYLLIEDTDLVQWKVGRETLPGVSRVSIKHCYKLEDMYWEPRLVLPKMELVDCNPAAVTYVKNAFNLTLLEKYSIHSSWDDGNVKS